MKTEPALIEDSAARLARLHAQQSSQLCRLGWLVAALIGAATLIALAR